MASNILEWLFRVWRTTPTTLIPDAPSLKQKKSGALSAAVQTIRSALPEIPAKNLPTQNHSPKRTGGTKFSQLGHSHNQNDSPKSVNPDARGELVGSQEVEQSSRKGNRKNGSYVEDGDTPEIFYAATSCKVHSALRSSTAGHQEAKGIPLEANNVELCISDDGSKSSCNLGHMSSLGQKVSKDLQAVLLEVLPDDPQGVDPQAVLPELMDDVIGRLPMLEVMQLRAELGKAFRNAIHRPAFLRNRPDSEGEFSPSFFMTDDKGDLHWHGFDTLSREWTRLPSLNFAKMILPSPDPDIFKDYLVAGDGGLLCINVVGKAPGREKLVICNPLTQQVKVLPPLNHARGPVLMHLKVDQHDSEHYKIFVAGSAATVTKELNLKTEEYDSRKGVWECPDGSDLPCPAFGLNEYQNGVYFKDDSERELLMCVAIVDTRGRGMLKYDIRTKKWAQGPDVKQLHIPLVEIGLIHYNLATTQIVECGGSVFVFSEQECGLDAHVSRDVYFVIHKLIPDGSGDFTWYEVMRRKRTGGRGLLVYPEFTCVPISEHELCIFNTVEHTIEIIDLNNPTEVTPLKPDPTSKGKRFHTLNPIGFVFKPSFRSVVCPRGRDSKLRCNLKLGEYCSECQGRGSVSLRSGLHMNAGLEVINRPVSEEEAESTVVTAPTEETNTTGNLVESLGSDQEKFLEGVGELLQEARDFLGQLPEPDWA